MKKFLKKTEGFTLVELIIVIAILGILAAVAVPAYSGYLTEAKEAADITTVDAIKTAAQAALATKGEVTNVTIVAGASGSITATVEGDTNSPYLLATNDVDDKDDVADTDFADFYTQDIPNKFETGAAQYTWDKDGDEWVPVEAPSGDENEEA